MFLNPRLATFPLALCLLVSAAWGQTTLRVEVVDDTGSTFSPYLLLVGQDAAGAGTTTYPLSVDPAGGNLALADAGLATNNVAPLSINQLKPAGYNVTSLYTGQPRPVYYFNVTTIGAGAFMVFQNDGSGTVPFTYINNANPSPVTANYRFDQCEITFNSNITSGANLTSIDAFSMPMQYELFTGTYPNLTPVDQRKYYLSTQSMLTAFQNIGAGQALYKLGPATTPVKGWTPADGMAQFVRALGPGQAAAPSSLGNPAPYPTFATYLQQLVGPPAAATFTIAGNANGSGYSYTGQVQSDNHGGYQILLNNGTTNPPPPSPLPSGANVTVNLPINQQATASATGSASGALTALNVNTAGAGYNNPPIVTISPPTIFPAAASANVAGGAVTGFNIISAGSGYTSVPTVTITSPVGTDAAATAILTGGAVTGFSITNAGSGYTGPPNVTLSPPPPGSTATATANVSAGAVTGFNITDAGAGYTRAAAVNITPPAGSMDTFLYGATLSADAFSVVGVSYATLQGDTNIVYGAIARDALAAINFGYVNGRYGSSSVTWYGAAPTAFPFGLARATNDGYYNPWAAILYNNSDAYGFAFSDRSGPSPLMGLQAGQTMRITLLPDARLDSPKPYVADVQPTSMEIEWQAVPNATGYLITVLAPSGISPINVSAQVGINRFPLSGLNQATPYTFTVAATGTANSNPLVSPAQPVQGSTTGSRATVTGAVQFNMAMSWSPPTTIASPPAVSFDNQTLTYQSNTQWLNNGLNATLSGVTGSANQYVMTLQDANQQVIFTNIITATFSLVAGSMTNFTVAEGTLFGNAQPLTPSPPAASYVSNGGSGQALTLVVPFNPIPQKAFAPALVPGVGYNQWVSGFSGLANAAPAAAPQNDGISNLQKYFQGLDPLVAGPFDTSAVDVTIDQLVFRYRKSKSITGVTPQVEWSADLLTWQTSDVTFDPEQDFGDHLQCTARVSRASGAARFIRLRVILTQARSPKGSAQQLGARR